MQVEYIIGVILLIFSVWFLSCIRNLDRNASKGENIRSIIFFLIGCILMCISLKLLGWLDKWFS
jgi:hypothetical protein